LKLTPLIVLCAVLTVPAAEAAAETVTLTSDRDATLIENTAGKLANGIGPDLYTGRTAQPQGSIRRALLHFDLSAIPRNATIESVRLKLHVSQATAKPAVLSVHRGLADWGEGPSFATGGGGVPALPGDSTWTHRFYDPSVPAPPQPPASPASPHSSNSLWLTPGGDYLPSESASLDVPSSGFYIWEDARLVEDVREWVDRPKRNFGWLLVGGESQASTARRLDSRQGMLPNFQPQLEVSYRRQ